jgi:hypothetical protein
MGPRRMRCRPAGSGRLELILEYRLFELAQANVRRLLESDSQSLLFEYALVNGRLKCSYLPPESAGSLTRTVLIVMEHYWTLSRTDTDA